MRSHPATTPRRSLRARCGVVAALAVVLAATLGGASQADGPAVAGQVYAFGNDDSGEIGTSTLTPPTSTFSPVLVDLPAGSPHADFDRRRLRAQPDRDLGRAALRVRVNGGGELGTTTSVGTGTPESTPTPVTLPGDVGGVTQAAAGQFFSLAATSTGQLYAFGANLWGQLGNPINNQSQEPNPTPTLVTLPGASGPVAQVAAGGSHSLALTSSGQLYAFGENYFGQLGNVVNSWPAKTPN